MKTSMDSAQQPIPPRCAEIRERLEDFAGKRLGPADREEVQDHVLGCDACSDALAELLMEQVADGSLPLLVPPSIPSPTVYDNYLRARRSRTSWRALLDAMVNPDTREWAAARMDEIRAGLTSFMNPIATGGVLRPRGAAPLTLGELIADVLTPAGEPSGAKVTFRIRTAPEVGADGRFRFVVSTDAAEYDGRRVICAIALDNAEPVAFEGTLARLDRQDGTTAVFNEEDLPAHNCRVPLDRVTLTIA